MFTIWKGWLDCVVVAVAVGSQTNVSVSSVPSCRLCVSLQTWSFSSNPSTTRPLSAALWLFLWLLLLHFMLCRGSSPSLGSGAPVMCPHHRELSHMSEFLAAEAVFASVNFLIQHFTYMHLATWNVSRRCWIVAIHRCTDVIDASY